MSKEDVEKIKTDIALYENEINSLEKVKTCSDVGPCAIKYIDKHVNMLKKHVFDLHTQIDMIERD